jgi:POT family proton-dependent oligopeptide transporter
LLIIVLTPVLVRYWNKRAARVGATNLMQRMGFGCVMATAASLVMVAAAWTYSMTGHPVSPWWVIAYFTLLTVGELHVLPIGLSLFGTLAPVHVASVVMGAWFIAKFLGSVLAGVMGTLWQQIPPEAFFGIGAATTLLASAALYRMGYGQIRRDAAERPA